MYICYNYNTSIRTLYDFTNTLFVFCSIFFIYNHSKQLIVMAHYKSKSDRLDAARKEKGLSLSALGDAINMSEAGVRQFLKRDNVRDLYLDVFEENFGISKQWVKTGEGEMIISNTPSFIDVLSILQSNKDNLLDFDIIYKEVVRIKCELEETKTTLINVLNKHNDLLEVIRKAGYNV